MVYQLLQISSQYFYLQFCKDYSDKFSIERTAYRPPIMNTINNGKMNQNIIIYITLIMFAKEKRHCPYSKTCVIKVYS